MNSVLAFAAVLVCAAPSESYRIAGTVADSLTGAALDRVRVSIAPTSERTRLSYATTGADGRFVFDDLPAGKWVLAAERRGYLPHSFGQPPTLAAPGIAIVTGPGESTEDLVFRLCPPAMLTGKVTDSAGDPVEDALVQVLGWATIGGRRQVRPARYGWTNDDGAYAIGSLPAGLYFVAVTGRPWYADSLEEHGRAVAFPPHLYPNTTEPRTAAPILLRPGEETTVDFTLTPAPAVTLTLTAPGQPVRVRLGSEGIHGLPIWQHTSESASKTHRFRLVPGRYTVWFASSNDEQPAIQTIELPTLDTVVQLTPAQPANVDAVVEVQGSASLTPGSLGLILVSEDGTRSSPRMLPPGGAVKYPPMPPGRYRLMLVGPAVRDAYIEQVSAEGAHFGRGLLELGAGAEVSLRVAVSRHGGHVEGKVYRADRPFPSALVVLAPRTDTGNPTDYRGFVSDNDGSFEYRSIKPGDYVIFAIEDGSQLEYTNPAAVAPYLESGRPVRVEPDGTLNLRLELPAG